MTDTGCHEPPVAREAAGCGIERMTTVTASPGVVTVGAHPLHPEDVVAVARHGAHVAIDPDALARVAATRSLIEGLADDPEPHYGISTGFGALATTFIPLERRMQLQASLIRSHAAGTGAEVETEVVRALQLLRLQTLASGRTGVRPVVVETYAAMLNAGITPIVREYGSLGCSGDLAPLSHVALAAMGEGEVRVLRRRETDAGAAAEALAAASIAPLELREKEGLALINGTDGMLGMLLLALHDLQVLLDTADVAAAMSIECAARHGRGVRRRPHGAPATARPGRLGREPADAARRLGHHGVPPRPCRVHARAGRLLAALLAPGARRGPRHGRARRADRVARARGIRRQSGRDRRRPRRVERQLPRRAGRVCARLPRDRGSRCRLDLGAAHRPRPRRRAQPRAAPVPRRRGRRRLRPHDRAVRGGGDRVRAQAARGAGIRRLDPVVGDAGGPRLDGLGGRPQAAPRRSTASPACSRSRCSPAARAIDLRAPLAAGARDRRGARPRAHGRGRPGPRPLRLARHRGCDRARALGRGRGGAGGLGAAASVAHGPVASPSEESAEPDGSGDSAATRTSPHG